MASKKPASSKDRPELHKPLAVLMSKRACVFYLEHVRVQQRKGVLVFLTDTGQALDRFYNIPDKNTVFLMLGKGSSITDTAVRLCAESNVLVGFTGSGGTPLHAVLDPVFLVPQDEYRPTEYMQNWVERWSNPEQRLLMAKQFCEVRLRWDERGWREFGLPLPQALLDDFRHYIATAPDVTNLLTAEGRYAAHLYGLLAKHYGFAFSRAEGKRQTGSTAALANSFLDHGNYLAYGYAAVVLHTLGISYAFPVMHGKTRRGGLVFDVADLLKDWLVLPTAFQAGKEGWTEQQFRATIIDKAAEYKSLDAMFDVVKSIALTGSFAE